MVLPRCTAPWTTFRFLGVAALLALLAPAPVEASGIGTSRMTVDFTNPEDAMAKTRWDETDVLKPGEKGLGWGGESRNDQDTMYDASVRVVEPMGLGTSWRPPDNAMVRVKVTWAGPHAGDTAGFLFVRYGCDAAHWTQWMPVPLLRDAGKAGPVKEYQTELKVPRDERVVYETLLREYEKKDVPWKSDEEAFVTHLLRKSPRALSSAKPFVGYLQFLYDTTFRGGTHLVRLDVEATWVLPGPAYAPSDPKLRVGRDGPWRFRADGGHESRVLAKWKRWRKEVYQAVLRRTIEYGRDGLRPPDRRPRRLVIDPRISPAPALPGELLWRDATAVAAALKDLPLELLHAFRDDNRNAGEWLPADLDAGVPISYVDLERFARPFGGDADAVWKAFHRRWPHSPGYVTLSGVGIVHSNGSAPLALVHVGRMWGALAGHGIVFYLALEGGAWVVKGEITVWVS